MEIVNHIKYDIAKRGVAPVIDAVQGEENSRVIELSLFANGSAFDVSDSLCSLAFKKPDGTSGWYDTMPDGSSAYSVTENVVSVKIAPQVLTVAGEVNSVIRIESADNAERATTFPIIIDVSADPAIDAPKSENYYKVQNWDDVNVALALAVSYDPQPEVTEAQKAKARENIGAADELETADIRVGYDGKTYPTAGDAVRGSVKQIADVVTEDAIWTETGYINTSGFLTSHDSYITTDFVPLVNGGVAQLISYRVQIPKTVRIGLYNVRKELIGKIAPYEGEGVAICEGVLNPEEVSSAYYVRFSTLNTYAAKKVTFGRLSIAESGINTEKIANKAVTIDKIDFVTHLQGTNFIDKANLTLNAYVNATGAIATYEGFRLTDYIKLEENTAYYFYCVLPGYYAFYDAEYNLISAAGNDYSLPNPFKIPAGAVYGRFTMISPENAEAAWIHTENVEPPAYGVAFDGIGFNTDAEEVKPTEYEGDDICVFVKGICIGDSLTQGTMNYIVEGGTNEYINIAKYSYPSILSKMTGIEITNKGRGGATSAEWYEAEQNSDLSGYDFAIVQLGVNDSYRYNGWTDTSVQGFTSIINKLKAENKNIKIFVATIMPAISYKGATIDAISQGIRDFVNGLADPDVILLDMAVYGHTKDSTAFNCGHLSAYGYWRLAKDYKAYISWYMNKNKDTFREVQFIGTDYVYDV